MASFQRRSSVRSELNDRLFWVILPILAISPLLFGSNRPIFWAMWATLLGLTGMWWFGRMSSTDERFRITVHGEWGLAGCFGAMGLYMLVQILPLGSFLPPFSTPTAPDLQMTASTISLTPGDTLLAFLRWVSYGLLFFFAAQMAANRSRADRMLRGIYWIVVVHAVIGLAFRYQFGDTLLGIPKISYLGSATAGFVNRNSYATFLAFGTVVGLALVLERTVFPARAQDPKASRIDAYTGKGGVVQILVGWLVILAALFASNSRMGVAAALCGMILVVGLAFAKSPPASLGKPVWLTVAGMIVTLGLVLFLHGQTFIERLGDASQDSDIRLDIYAQVISMIKIRPWTGFGGNSFEYVYPLFHDYPVNVNFIWDKTHNTYLANWVEYGVLFGSLPLVILGIVVFRLLKDFIQTPGADILCLTALGAIMVGAVHSLVDFSLEIEAVTFLFSVLIGAGFARATARQQRAGE